MGFAKQINHLDFQTLGNLLKALERDVGFAALYGAHVVAVDANPIREALLGVAGVLPESPDRLSKLDSER